MPGFLLLWRKPVPTFREIEDESLRVGCLPQKERKRRNITNIMNEKKRQSNEIEFDSWIDNDTGGRIYYFEINGKFGWKAKYLKRS